MAIFVVDPLEMVDVADGEAEPRVRPLELGLSFSSKARRLGRRVSGSQRASSPASASFSRSCWVSSRAAVNCCSTVLVRSAIARVIATRAAIAALPGFELVGAGREVRAIALGVGPLGFDDRGEVLDPWVAAASKAGSTAGPRGLGDLDADLGLDPVRVVLAEAHAVGGRGLDRLRGGRALVRRTRRGSGHNCRASARGRAAARKIADQLVEAVAVHLVLGG